MFRVSSKGPKQQSRAVKALPLERCLAKTRKTATGIELGATVEEHALLTGLVARELIGTFPAECALHWFPKGSCLTASAHDDGKITPTFQKKLYASLTNEVMPPELADADPDLTKGRGHDAAGEVAVRALAPSRYVSQIVGVHHGRRPNTIGLTAEGELLGGPAWQARRAELCESLKAALDEDWPVVRDALHAKVLAGLTTVSDWVSSGCPALYRKPEIADARAAVRRAGFEKAAVRPGLTFRDIFGFEPNDVQKGVFAECRDPGVYVLEAPMGLGKTEAALYAAYRMLEAGKATGLYFALPTQTTSACMHERVNEFLNAIVPSSSNLRKAALVHGNAEVSAYAMGGAADAGGEWFRRSKRGILAPFGVGTIDQALMAVMNVKHGFVRTFGLLGKVVILDEVHSYDMYTGTVLDELVSVLRRLGSTVIILSATLTESRRRQLTGVSAQSGAYPLLTSVYGCDGRLTALPPPADKQVAVELRQDEDALLSEALHRARSGEQVLWIENTVGESQRIFAAFKAAAAGDPSVELGLIHSRFMRRDRQARESYWVSLLGKKDGELRARRGRILVGTQVLEQSIDIDADLLVTRLCPTDMLLQRLGRLWRHAGTGRPASAQCRTLVLAPSVERVLAEPTAAFGPSGFVYAPYVLLRTLEVWEGKTAVTLPADIRPLLEATYAERREKGTAARLHNRMVEGDTVGKSRRLGTRELRNLALAGISAFAPEADDDAPPTRYSERPTVDVLLLKSITEKNGRTVLSTLADEEIVLDRNDRRRAAAALLAETLSVPVTAAPKPDELEVLASFRGFVWLSEKPETRIRIVLVNDDGAVRTTGGVDLAGMRYDAELGWQTLRNE